MDKSQTNRRPLRFGRCLASPRPRRASILVLAFAFLAVSVVLSFAGTYTVRKNDTLTGIAQNHGVNVGLLVEANRLRDQNRIFVGQRLTIPEPGTRRTDASVVVQKDETLSEIAERHGVTVTTLARANDLNDSNHIYIGQRLLVPGGAPEFALESRTMTVLKRVAVTSKKWRSVVIHHSAMPVGTLKGMDNYHRHNRRMENGLAYHFVIGNGRGIQDGRVEVGNRWRKQLDGGHLHNINQNRSSIGICLVGNFQRSLPTKKQMASLNALVDYLLDRCRLPSSSVKTHREVNEVPTICPGAKFPEKSFLRALSRRRSTLTAKRMPGAQG